MSAGDTVGAFIDDPASADLAGAANVLVVAPTLADGVRESYYETLLRIDPTARDVLAVQYSRTPRQYLAEWDRHRDAVPQQCGIIAVGEPPTQVDERTPDRGAVTRVTHPDDLTGIGLQIERYLVAHGDADTVVTFDSLTVLLQYVALERAFRFLAAIASRIRELDAVAHYHVDPNAHDDEVLATLSSAVDGVARYDDGDWETRRR